ncbi:MAG TPA: uracil/xanthine transporter [Bacilli bacterium]
MYKLKETTKTTLASLQWLSFLFANTVVIPLSVGEAYQLSPIEISGSMARSFVFTGLACLMQALFGHRLPLMEGQTGLWWGVILSIASLGISSGKSIVEVGGSLSVGIMAGGAAIILFGTFGLHRMLKKWFTPIVMAVLLFLLASQLIDIFFAGMTGITSTGKVQGPVALLSVFLVIAVSILTIAGRGSLSNFSILIGIVIGWVAYVLLFGSAAKIVIPRFTDMTEMFVWGKPSFDFGILAAGVCTGLINTSNAVATFRAAEPVFNMSINDGAYRRSFIWSGIFTVFSGIFALVPYAPYTSSIGFLRTTRLYERAPFIIGAVLFAVLGCVPQVVSFFSTLPLSVGDAVLFVAYLQLFGSALGNIEGMRFNFKSIFRIALPTLVGLAIQATPSGSFADIPGFMHTILSNGMLVGIIIAVILENTIPWSRLET